MTSYIKKTKRYSEQLKQVLIMISILTVDSFQNKNKFQIFKLFTESLQNKGQTKKNGERNDEQLFNLLPHRTIPG